MKAIILALFSFVLFYSCSTTNKNEVTILGKITGDIPDEIFYTYPVNETYLYGLKETITPDSLGCFTIKMDVSSPSFSHIVIYGHFTVNLLIEPGGQYEIRFDLKEKNSSFKITGDSYKGLELLNNFSDPAHAQIETMKYLSYTDASKFESEIDSILNDEIMAIDSLFAENLVSDSFYQLVKTDRKVFYDAVKGNFALLKWSNDKRNNDGSFNEECRTMWNRAVGQVSVTNHEILKSSWAFNLVENYMQNKEYLAENYDRKKFSEMQEKGLRHTHKLSFVDANLEGIYKEWYTATYLLFHGGMQKKYQREFISLFDKFKLDFPESRYTVHLEPFVSEIVEFHKIAEQDFPEGVVFVNDYVNLNSLNDCLKPFAEKNVYVDIWATWCSPCKKEFQFKDELNKLLKSKNIEMLYISTNRDEDNKQWLDMIKYYNLRGNHLRANNALKADLKNTLGRYGIPRFLLVNKLGEIVNIDAPRPSEINDLKVQLEKYF